MIVPNTTAGPAASGELDAPERIAGSRIEHSLTAGQFSTFGGSSLQPDRPDAALAHELYHGFEYAVGLAPVRDNDAHEQAAWRFENVYRRQAGLPSRDCYDKCK